MLPTLHIPLEDQLGMSKALHGARRSTLKEALAHRFKQLVLGTDEEFVAVLNRYVAALGKIAQPPDPNGQPADQVDPSEWSILLENLIPGGQIQWDVEDQQAIQDAWKSPLAGLLATVLHCMGHKIAESAFMSNDASSGDAPAGMEDEDERKPVAIDVHRLGEFHGHAPQNLMRIELYHSFLRVELGRALRYIATGNHRQQQTEGGEKVPRLKIGRATYELFAGALLDALPAALGENNFKWLPEHTSSVGKALFKAISEISGERWQGPKTQRVLWLDDGLRENLIRFLDKAPLTFTLQPLLSPPQYVDQKSDTHIDTVREVPLLGYKHMNSPLEQYLDLLRPKHFERFLPGINAQQKVAWRLNEKVLNCAWVLADLKDSDRAMLGLSDEQFSAWRAWANKALYCQKDEGKSGRKILPGKYLTAQLVKSVLDDAFEEGTPKSFYLPWKADYRGRIYAETPWLTPQGGDLQRALLEFVEGSDLDLSGWVALKRHGGNLADRDLVLGDQKAKREVTTLAERERWVELNEQDILACAENPFVQPFWRNMAKPWQFLAFCFAYADGKKGIACHTPVQIDGTCNGLQHIAALTGDHDLAVEVNVCVDEDIQTASSDALPHDIYSRIAKTTRQIFPAWLDKERQSLTIKLAEFELLARHPEWFVEDPDRPPDCVAACAGSDVQPKNLEKVLSRLLQKAKIELNKLEVENPTPRQLEQAAVKRNRSDEWGARSEIMALDLLTAKPVGLKEKRFELYLNRSVAKAIVMTIPYGASKSGQVKSLIRDWKKKEIDFGLTQKEIDRLSALHEYLCSGKARRPKFDANRLTRELLAGYIVPQARIAINREFRNIEEFARTLKTIARSAESIPLLWKTPLGLPVFQDGFKLNEQATMSMRLSPNSETKINFVRLENNVDPGSQQRKLLPNLIHSLDASHLLSSLQSLSDKGISRFGSIHDCLLIHPNEAKIAGDVLRTEFANLYKHELGKVPAIYKNWLDWLELLHEVAEFPNRASDLLSPLGKVLRFLSPLEANVILGERAVLGNVSPQPIESPIDSLLPALAEKAKGFPKLADFVSQLADDGTRAEKISDLVWLVLLLKHGKKQGKETDWIEKSTPASQGFDINSVLRSPYFFS